MTTDDPAGSAPPDGRGLSFAVTILIEVVVAVSVWGLLGLIVDVAVGTGPWVQFVGLLVGTMIALALAQRRATSPAESEPSDG